MQRTIGAFSGQDRSRIILSILGVSIAISLLLVVSGLALGLAMGATVMGDDVNYVIVPSAASGGESAIAAPDNPQFGAAHDGLDAILASESVERATPVLFYLSSIERHGEVDYLLVIGIVPDHAPSSVAGLPTDHFSSGITRGTDEWTGELVVSEGGAEVLGIATEDTLMIRDSEFTVRSVAKASGGDIWSGIPVALAHLSELQTASGFDEHDRAHQFLVVTDSSAAGAALERIYPDARVLTQSGLAAESAMDSGLPIALGATALIVALMIGTLFVSTAMGLEVLATRDELIALRSIGGSTRATFSVVAIQTIIIAFIGGLVGIAGGYFGIALINAALANLSSFPAIAMSPWWFSGFGLFIALLIGMISLPYLYFLIRRTAVIHR